MEGDRLSFQVILGFEWIAALICYKIIWSYLNKKPLGRTFHSIFFIFSLHFQKKKYFLGIQTLFDSMIKDYIFAALCALMGSTLSHLKYWKMTSEVALAIIWFQYFSAVVFFGQIFFTFVFRYCSIFHMNLLNHFEESFTLLVSR